MANLKISQLEKITNMDADAYILVVQNGKNYRMSIKEAIAANVDLGDVDLSNYYTKEEVFTKEEVRELIDGITAGNIDLANYYTISQVDEKVENLQGQIDNIDGRLTVVEDIIETPISTEDLETIIGSDINNDGKIGK